MKQKYQCAYKRERRGREEGEGGRGGIVQPDSD